MWLGHVENPTDSPNDWRVTQRKIPFDRPSPKGNQTFGSAVLKHDGFIYIYGIDEEKKLGFLNRFMTVARVDEATIGDYDTWRFYRDGAWQDDWIKSGRIFNGIATEYSVSYQPSLKKFIVVYTENGMSENILIRLADHPWGPWSDPATIYRCPEAGWDSSYFCYAAKGHPSLSKPNELIIAYVTNSFDFGKMVSDARIYRPRFLRLTFK